MSTNIWQRALLTVTFLLIAALPYEKQPTVWLNFVSGGFFFISGWDTTGRQEYSVNWIIHGNRDTQSQGFKGMCKQLNKNKTLTAVWPIAGLLCACKHSRRGRWEGLQSWGASWAERGDCGAIRFQASPGTSYYRAHFIKIHFQLSDVPNTLSEEHNPVK